MPWKVMWDQMGPEPDPGQEQCGLSYKEALYLQLKLSAQIDNLHIQIRKEKFNGSHKQVRRNDNSRGIR